MIAARPPHSNRPLTWQRAEVQAAQRTSLVEVNP